MSGKSRTVFGILLECVDEPVFMSVPKALKTEYCIHERWEGCGQHPSSVPIFVLTSWFKKM